MSTNPIDDSTSAHDAGQHSKEYSDPSSPRNTAHDARAAGAESRKHAHSESQSQSQSESEWTRTQRRAGASATPEEALAKALQHARSAISEILQALGHLIDATALATTSQDSSAREWLDMAQRALGSLGSALDERSKSNDAQAIDAVLDALDQEIQRWQAQAETSPEARAVLRAYLGLREILWEFGFRRSPKATHTKQTTRDKAQTASRQRGAHSESSTKSSARPKRGRVQRIPVEG